MQRIQTTSTPAKGAAADGPPLGYCESAMLVAGPYLSGMIAVRSTATGSTLHDEDPAASHREHHHHGHPQATSGLRVAQDRGRRWGVAFPPPQGHTLENRKRTISVSLVHAGMTWNDRNPLYLCEIHVRKDSGFPLSVRAFSISGLRVLLTNSSIVVRSAGRSAMSFTRPSLRAAAVFLS